MVQKAHPLTFSNFFSNHIINPCDKALSLHDRKVALTASVIFGFFTIGLVHGIVFIARLSLCSRIKKIESSKPDDKKNTFPLVIQVPNLTKEAKHINTMIDQEVVDIIAEQLGVDKGDVTPEKFFLEDLNADSFDLIELIMTFEERFGCEIPDEGVETLKTVDDAIKYIHANNAS